MKSIQLANNQLMPEGVQILGKINLRNESKTILKNSFIDSVLNGDGQGFQNNSQFINKRSGTNLFENRLNKVHSQSK